ncbi:transglutaminase domain-containing protein [Psychroserpens sp. MEBiC05023]
MIKTITFIFIFFIAFSSKAQDYSSVDAIVKNYPNRFKSIDDFAHRIELDFDSDINKVRAVFYWVSNHIAYDFKSATNNTNGYKYINSNPDDGYEERLLQMHKTYAERALKRKLAVCEGYSQLIKFTLNALDIKSEVIHGFAKVFPSEIGIIRNTTNHAWNVVKIDNEWKLLDATWATGIEINQPKIFNFTDTYFLISPEHLILTHFPKEEQWQLLYPPITKSNYFFKPIFYEAYFSSGLELNMDSSGIIKAKQGTKIKLIFDHIDEDKMYYYAYKDQKVSKPLVFEKRLGKYITKIPFYSKRKTHLGIFDNTDGVLEFKVLIER